MSLSLRCFAFFAVYFLALGAWAQPAPNWKFVENKLKANKFSKEFIGEMKKTYEVRGFEEVLRLNVLLFLKKSDYHGPQVSSQAADDVRKFLARHEEPFARAEALYGVSPQVVSSLLWIESRHGKNLGDYHVPSVYLHLIQGPRMSVQKYLLTQTGRYTPKTTPEQRRRIVERTKTKSDWALAELKAIEKVFKWKWKIGKEFRGSFSGAFGYAQFIPSSYVKYARPFAKGTQPNLNKPQDAIMSVAHYLKQYGWKQNRPAKKIEALMHYNNSRDYANAILSLAEKATERRTASLKKKVEKKPVVPVAAEEPVENIVETSTAPTLDPSPELLAEPSSENPFE